MVGRSVMWSRCAVPSGVPRCTPVFHGGGAGVHGVVGCTPVFHGGGAGVCFACGIGWVLLLCC